MVQERRGSDQIPDTGDTRRSKFLGADARSV
jgi:hypothetical protein